MRRANIVIREREQQRNTELRRINRLVDYLTSAGNYEEEIKQGPTYVCISCGGMFFPRSVREFNEAWVRSRLTKNADFKKATTLLNKGFIQQDRQWICITCRKYIEKNKLPHLSLGNGLEFPIVHNSIQILNELEERLISPRIPFIRIRTLFDGQRQIRGNIVNVPVDTNETIEFLPREFDESKTIQLKFMRRMDYNTPYMFDKIRPACVVRALQAIVKRPLFASKEIKVKLRWRENPLWQWSDIADENDIHNFIIEAEDMPEGAETNMNPPVVENLGKLKIIYHFYGNFSNDKKYNTNICFE